MRKDVVVKLLKERIEALKAHKKQKSDYMQAVINRADFTGVVIYANDISMMDARINEVLVMLAEIEKLGSK